MQNHFNNLNVLTVSRITGQMIINKQDKLKTLSYLKNKKELQRDQKLSMILISLYQQSLDHDDCDIISSIFSEVEMCERLTLELSCNGLTRIQIDDILMQIKQIKGLKKLELGLGMNYQYNNDLSELVNCIKNTKNEIQELSLFLYANRINNIQLNDVSQVLMNSQLTRLQLRFENNLISDEGIIQLSQSIQSMNQLQSIELGFKNNEQISEKSFVQIIDSIFSCSTQLENVYLNFNVNPQSIQRKQLQYNCFKLKSIKIQLLPSTISSFINVSPQNEQCFINVEEIQLNFQSTELQNTGIEDILNLIKSSTHLKKLDFQVRSHIPCEYLKQLSVIISQKKFLESLIFNTLLDGQQIQSLFNEQYKNIQLKEFENNLEDISNIQQIQTLSDLLQTQQKLLKLKICICYSKIEIESVKPLLNSFSKLIYLKELHFQLSNLSFCNDFGQILGESFQNLADLQTLKLYLSDNQLDSKNCKDIFDGLTNIHKLEKLYVSFAYSYFKTDNLQYETQSLSKLSNLKYLFLVFSADYENLESDCLYGIVQNICHLKHLLDFQVNFYDLVVKNEKKIINTLKKIPQLVNFKIIL